jgi:D-3-phosphoglycerate dehydrogenase
MNWPGGGSSFYETLWAVHRIWVERELPARFLPMLAGVAELVAPGTPASGGAVSTLHDVHGIVAAARTRYDGALMDRVPTLRVIARMGIGYDNVSLAEATRRGIAVCNVPDGPTISTAEHSVMLLLATVKRLNKWQSAVKADRQVDYFGAYDGEELYGLRLGLIGLGRIGLRVAAAALALGMMVTAHDPFVNADLAAQAGVELVPALEELLATADVVSLHLPLTSETHHLINAQRLALMKPGAFLVNTSRGGLVDEAALLHALETGHLGGAGMDVFEIEPPTSRHPLLHRNDIVFTPHVAGGTRASKDRLWGSALSQVLDVLRGKRPEHLVNPEVWSQLEHTFGQ